MRELTVRWIGPFAYRNALYVIPTGLYMVFVGQHPIYLGAALDLGRTLSSHAVVSSQGTAPGDMLGRELLDYSRRYHQPLTVKLATVLDANGRAVGDLQTLEDVAALLVLHHQFPCNLYGRDQYDGTQALSLTNVGKSHPLERTVVSEEEGDNPQ